MRASTHNIKNSQSRNREELFFEMLNELRRLNNIGFGHTKNFVSICEKKKREVKDQLNNLVIELRNSGTENPDLRRYI